MIYLVGGPARVGKSTLAKRFRSYIDAEVIDGDAFTHSMHDVLKSEWLPDIFVGTIDPINAINDPSKKVDRLRKRDEAMWEFYEAYLKEAAISSSDDILIDGNFWPDYVHTLELPHVAVFLIDTSPAQAARLISIRDGDSDNNWMKAHEFTDEKIVEWATFNALRSEKYIPLCKEYGYRYFDIAERGVERTVDEAFEYLLQKVV